MINGISRLQIRSFFLFEILVALSLTAIILSFLFTAMTRTMKLEAKTESARSVLLERQRLQTRLQDLFLSLQGERLPPFYTQHFSDEKKTSLIVFFNNGIDPDPAYSGTVAGRIFLDEKNNLALAIWPMEKNKKKRSWRKEILCSEVEDFRFHLFGKSMAEDGKGFAWHDSWPQKRIETPSMIRLFITQHGEALPFAFFLANQSPFVTYREGGFRS